MPRHSTIYHPEPKEWFPCPVHGCSQRFRTQSGRTKHIHAKHKNELQSVSKISQLVPQAPIPSPNTSLPSDSNHQDADMPNHVPCTPHVPIVPSNFGFLGGMNVTQSPIPSDNDPTSPPPFQPEVENRPDQAERVLASLSTIYHPIINGTI